MGDNFLAHLAPVSIGVFFFGSFKPNAEDTVQAQRALYKTSFLFRHFLQPGGLKATIEEGSLSLSGRTTSQAVALMGAVLGREIMGEGTVVADHTSRRGETSHRKDDELRARLQLMVATDALLASEEMEIRVSSGCAEVHGLVASASHKGWAETLLRGVAPEAQIGIATARADRQRPQPSNPSIDDDSLQALALVRLQLIPALAGIDFRAVSQRQALTLSGRVPDLTTQELAESIARHTFGLRSFKSQLQVV